MRWRSRSAVTLLPRRVCGKVKHLEVKKLWLQEHVRSGKVDIQRSRMNNPSGALTHHYIKEDGKKRFMHMTLEVFEQRLAVGDPESGI